jgi:hypothetical protein
MSVTWPTKRKTYYDRECSEEEAAALLYVVVFVPVVQEDGEVARRSAQEALAQIVESPAAVNAIRTEINDALWAALHVIPKVLHRQ